MSPELIIAVKERIERGYTDTAIREELHIAGHTDEVIEQVVSLVRTAPAVVNIPEAEPPAILDLFSAGWKMVMTRYDLVLALALPLSILGIWGNFIDTSISNVPYAVTALIAILCYVLALIASIYIITKENDCQISLGEGIEWASKHGLKMIWLYILVMAITYGGTMLFFVPGIIVMIITFFTPYVFVKEGLGGMKAVMRSRELVTGRWWLVFGQLFKILLLIIGAAVGVGIVSGVLVGLVPDMPIKGALLGVVMQFVMTSLLMVGIYTGSGIYRWLVATRPATNAVSEDKWKYTTLAWLGITLPVVLILTAIVLASLSSARDAARKNEIEVQEIDYKEQLQNERKVPTIEDYKEQRQNESNNDEFFVPIVPTSTPETSDIQPILE